MNRLLNPQLETVRSPIGAGLLLGVLTSHAVALVGALSGWPWAYFVAALLSVLLDVVAQRSVAISSLLRRAQFGYLQRAVIRELGLVVLFARLDVLQPWAFAIAALAVLALPTTRLLMLLAAAPVARRRLRPVEVRNLDLPFHVVSDPPRWALVEAETLVLLSAVPLAMAALGVLDGSWWPFLVSVGCLVLYSVAVCAALAHYLLSKRRGPSDATYLQLVAGEVRALRPELVTYFSGSPTSVYQLNMWLPVLERMSAPSLILLRERRNLPLVADTTLPIVCIPRAVDVMDFRMPSVRVAFYVANVGKNLHFLREPRIKHVFIGHGESDKIASVNPFTKVHDEIWVAGHSSRERWARARVGVRDESIVEVGRPQLGEIRHACPRAPGQPLTVLYAPTWEGWTADVHASSLPTMGVRLVRWLLERPVPTRVVYKPHPLTGTVSAAAKAAHEEIVRLVESRAGAHAGASTMPSDTGEVVEPSGEELSAYERWSREFWRTRPATHLVVEGPRPTLFDCFNHADVLVSDISSVVPDFLASGKPYLVTNAADRPHDEVREEYASTRAAYLADSDPASWEAAFEAIEHGDPLAPARAELRTYLLGPPYDDPVKRWDEALDDLVARAREEWPDAEAESLAAEHE